MTAILGSDKVIVAERKLKDQLIQKAFGEQKEGRLVLDLFEAAYLLGKKKLEIVDSKTKKISLEKLEQHAQKRDKCFHEKFVVFKELRDRGFVVKTGLKFGFDFRVYPPGKRPGQAHTQWVVNVATQNERFTMPQISRMIRLSGNLNTILLNAVVDSEDDVSYYELRRVTI